MITLKKTHDRDLGVALCWCPGRRAIWIGLWWWRLEIPLQKRIGRP